MEKLGAVIQHRHSGFCILETENQNRIGRDGLQDPGMGNGRLPVGGLGFPRV